jgi:hypothetical protein
MRGTSIDGENLEAERTINKRGFEDPYGAGCGRPGHPIPCSPEEAAFSRVSLQKGKVMLLVDVERRWGKMQYPNGFV